MTIPAHAVTQVYDSERNVIFIGGYAFKHAQEVLKEKPAQRFRKKIYEINVKKEESKEFIETKDDIAFFEVSNSGYIAVSTWKRVSMENNKTQLNTYLSIFNEKGQIVKTIENVPVSTEKKLFSWSPKGTEITFMRGRMLDESNIPFEPMGVWTYDIEKDELKKISDDGWDVRWAQYDNNVHILKYIVGPAYVYDTSTEKLMENKDGKGIVFSPDGKYYVGMTLEPGDWDEKERYQVFDGHLNKIIFTFEPDYTYWGESKFINDKYLLIWGHDWYFKVYDVMLKSNYVIPQEKVLLGWNEDMTKVVVYDGGDKIHIDELLTGKRLKSIDIPK